MSTKSKDSSGTSVTSSRTADKKGNESKSDDSQPQIPKQLKDSSDKGESTPPSCSNGPSQPQTVGNLGKSKGKNETTLSNQSSISSEGQYSGKGETNSDSGSNGNNASVKVDFTKMYDLLCAFRTALEHPNDLTKHNKVRATIKNSNLSKYYPRSPGSEPLFTFAERVNEWESEDMLPNNFINRVPGWIRMANLPYDHLRSACLKDSGEDVAYKSFSDVFSRLIEEMPVQPSTSSNCQNQQDVGSSHKVANDLNNLSSCDKDPIHQTKSRNVDGVENSAHPTKELSEYYRSVQKLQLELTANKADTVTVLQGAFTREGVKRSATAQERLLLHDVYKAATSYIENKSTDDEKQKVLEAVMDILI